MRIKSAKVSDPNSFVTCAGSDKHVLYAARLNDRGEVILTENGYESISQKINAEAEFTDIAFIRQRLAMGDTSVLRDEGVYMDVTKLPQTLQESLQIRLDQERAFNELPLEVRSKFNNNFNQWLMSSQSDEWFDKMGFVKKDEVIEKETVENEQEQ